MNYNDNKYIVYVFENKINSYKYIGITSMKLSARVYAHLYESKNKDNHNVFKEALRFYGIDSFNISELEHNLSINDAIDKEKFYINKYRTYIGFKDCRGYNSSIGGEGAHIISDEYLRINQYDLDGRLIKSYRSLREAEAISNISRVSISNVCKGEAITAGGYQWRKFIECGYDNIEKVKSGRDNVVKQVDQYDLDGNWIRTFSTLQEAADDVGCYSSTITKVCTGKLKMTHGYMWRYHSETHSQKIDPYQDRKITKRRIYQSDDTGIINIYNSIADASRATGFSMQSISNAINNDINAHGYKWSSDSEYEHKRKVVRCDLSGKIIDEFESVTEASRITKINRSSIYNCCVKKANTAGGFVWNYK